MVQKRSIKRRITRILNKYQVEEHECLIPSCPSDGYVTLLDPIGKDRAEEVDDNSINTEEIYFLCHYHRKMYGRYTRDELNTMDKVDPSFEELLNLTPIKIKDLLSSGNPRPQTDQALRQQNYRIFRHHNIDFKNLQCMVEDCADEAHIHIPDFNNHHEVQVICNYHQTREPISQTINVKTPSGIQKLKNLEQAMKDFKTTISKLENTSSTDTRQESFFPHEDRRKHDKRKEDRETN